LVAASGAVKSAIAWSVAGRSAVANNGVVATDANAMNNTDTPQIGAGFGGSIDGLITRISVWNSRLPDATLKALTA